MVNKIDGNQYNDYTAQRKTVNNIQDNGEKFSLNYKQDKLYSEENEKEDETSDIGKTKARTTERSGVRLELSQNSRQTGAGRRQGAGTVQEQSQPKENSLAESIRKFFTDLIQTAKNLFNRIWNDEEPEDIVQSSDVTPEEAERYTEEYLALKGIARSEPADELTAQPEAGIVSVDSADTFADKDAEIQKYLHSGNLEQVISLLTDNGQKTIAKNSNLLTYYDRSGRLTQINPSDRERILHGDRNSRKL